MSTDTATENTQIRQTEQVERTAEPVEQSSPPQSDLDQPYSSRDDHARELNSHDEPDEATDDTGSHGDGTAEPESDAARTDKLRTNDRESVSGATDTAPDREEPDPVINSSTGLSADSSPNRQVETRSEERERLDQSTTPGHEAGNSHSDHVTDEEFDPPTSSLDDTTNAHEESNGNSDHIPENDEEPHSETNPTPGTVEDSTEKPGSADLSQTDSEPSTTTVNDLSLEQEGRKAKDLPSGQSASELSDASPQNETAVPDSLNRKADEGFTFDKAMHPDQEDETTSSTLPVDSTESADFTEPPSEAEGEDTETREIETRHATGPAKAKDTESITGQYVVDTTTGDSRSSRISDIPNGDDDIADMGTRRHQRAANDLKSEIPAPPKEPGDATLPNDSPVYYREHSTTVGYDSATAINASLVKPEDGFHDVIVHGNNEGYFEPGAVNAAGEDFPGGEVHPNHIAESIMGNPDYDGGPIRLVSCHAGTVKEGSSEIPAAQAVADRLGVLVKAPTNKVGTSRDRGPDQEPVIFEGGYWKPFFPQKETL